MQIDISEKFLDSVRNLSMKESFVSWWTNDIFFNGKDTRGNAFHDDFLVYCARQKVSISFDFSKSSIEISCRSEWIARQIYERFTTQISQALHDCRVSKANVCSDGKILFEIQ